MATIATAPMTTATSATILPTILEFSNLSPLRAAVSPPLGPRLIPARTTWRQIRTAVCNAAGRPNLRARWTRAQRSGSYPGRGARIIKIAWSVSRARVSTVRVPRLEEGVEFAVLELDSPERFVSLRRALGVTSFGINLMLLAPRQQGRIHRHERQEEVYLVLEGTLTLSIEGEERELGAGELARVAPAVRRRLSNRGSARCAILALGGAEPHEGRDGVAYESWEATEGRPPQEIPLPDDLPA